MATFIMLPDGDVVQQWDSSGGGTSSYTDVDNDNGSFKYVPQSHKSKSSNQNKISLNGLRGNVFLADTSGLHCASQIIKNYRIITQIRFGKKDGYSPVVDGYCQSPSDEQLKFIKTNF